MSRESLALTRCAPKHPGAHREPTSVCGHIPLQPLSVSPGLIVGTREPPHGCPLGQIHSGVKVDSILVVRNVSTQENTRVHVGERLPWQ